MILPTISAIRNAVHVAGSMDDWLVSPAILLEAGILCATPMEGLINQWLGSGNDARREPPQSVFPAVLLEAGIA